MTYHDLMSSVRSEARLSIQSVFYLLRLSYGDSDLFWQYRQDLLKSGASAVSRAPPQRMICFNFCILSFRSAERPHGCGFYRTRFSAQKHGFFVNKEKQL